MCVAVTESPTDDGGVFHLSSPLVVGEAHLGVGYLAMWGKLLAVISYVNLYQSNIFLYF